MFVMFPFIFADRTRVKATLMMVKDLIT